MTQTLPPRTARAKTYLGLILLIPAAIACWIGWTNWSNVPVGGTVERVQVTTKQGFVGQAAEAVDNVKPESPDLYIQVFPRTGPKIVLPAYKDTPIGNGLVWQLPRQFQLADIDRIEIWDHNAMWKDKEFDRITLNDTWEADGQRFHIQLQGQKIQPPTWALPTFVGGAVAAGLVLLKFVWDQVV